jgi:hypothetical protein
MRRKLVPGSPNCLGKWIYAGLNFFEIAITQAKADQSDIWPTDEPHRLPERYEREALSLPAGSGFAGPLGTCCARGVTDCSINPKIPGGIDGTARLPDP